VTSETIARMFHLIREHSQKYGRDVWLLVDHTYWRLSFSSNAVPAPLSFYDQTILISSFSKDMSLAGERIGYIVVNPSAKNSGNMLASI
jgi:aspartate aminotransferase